MTRNLLTASAIALLVAAPLGFATPAAAKGVSHTSASHSHGHASSGHASAGGHHGSSGGGSKGGKSSGGGSGSNGLDTARSIMNLVGGFLPH